MSVLKNKLKITSKQLLSTLIVIATLVTSITIPQNIAYADGNYSGTNTGGGNGSMSATSDYKAYSKTDSGYRFYIINNKLERVSNIVDITITTPTNVKYWEKSTRFDTANSPNGIKTYTKSASEMKKLFGKYENSKEIYSGQPVLEWMPMPVFNENGVNKGAGKQFQSWFLKNVGVKQAQGGGNPTPVYKGGNGYIPGYNPTINNVYISTEASYSYKLKLDSDFRAKGKDEIKKSQGMNFLTDYYLVNALVNIQVNRYGSSLYNYYTSATNAYWTQRSANALVQSHSTTGAIQYATGAVKFNYSLSDKTVTLSLSRSRALFNNAPKILSGCITNKSTLSSYLKTYVQAGFIVETITYVQVENYKVENIKTANNILYQQIPLANEEFSVEKCPIETLLKSDLLNVEGYEKVAEAVLTGDYYLIVEPIVWLYVSTSPGKYDSYGNKTYGTYWNIVQKWGGNNTGSFYHTYMGTLGNNCLLVERDYTTTYSDETGKTYTIKGISQAERPINESRNLMNQGYGLSMHLYSSDAIKEADTSTHDEKLPGPGPAPDDTDKLVGSPDNLKDPKYDGNKDGHPEYANIVKFYELYKNDELLNTEAYTRTPCPKEIAIEDESLYKVEEWFTSTEFKEANDGDPNITSGEPRYNDYKSIVKNCINGTGLTTKTLKEESTLYVKLVYKEKTTNNTKTGDWTLTESRLTKQAFTNKATDSFDTSTNKLSGSIKYKLEALSAKHEPCLNFTCSLTGTTSSGKSKTAGTNCYNYCTEGTSDSDCHKKVKIYKCQTQGCKMYNIESKASQCYTNKEGYCGNKKKHVRTEYVHNCKGHTKNSTMSLSDSTLTAVIYASDINGALRTTHSSMTTGTITANRTSLNAENVTFSGFSEKFLVTRQGYDTALQYDGVVRNGVSDINASSSDKTFLRDIGFYNCKSMPVLRTSGAEIYNLSLTYLLNKDKSDFTTCSLCNNDPKKQEGCTHTASETVDENERDNVLRGGGTVAINTYAGSLTGAVMDLTVNTQKTMTPSISGYNSASGTMVQSGQFYFHPFIKMQYDTMSSQKQTVNVTGTWTRGMQVNDYAEVAWNYSTTKNNLHVTSNQWSAHAKALELAKKLGSNLKNVVLPGGAIYSLDTKGSNQSVMVSTYQTILVGEGLAQAEYTSPVSEYLKMPFAKKAHEAFKTQVKTSIETLPVEQYVSKDATQSNAWNKGKVVGRSRDISFLGNGSSKASSDSKYYFDNDVSMNSGLANESDLDVKELSTTYEYYTFYSTVNGDIYMAKSSGENNYPTEVGQKILSKNQGANKLNTQTEYGNLAQQINTRTLVVDKLCKAIERNTGNDKSASWASADGKWYNEAFNGVTVVIQRTKLEVGMTSPNLRTTILDPKLTPQQKDKGDIFTSAYLSQFKTSDTPLATGKQNVIGSFKGKDITLNKLDTLFWSNKFYIPNATVQDLS